MTPDLYALVVRLVADHDGAVRATQGHLAHAAFLNILDQADPDLAQAVHDHPGRNPFTISPLHGFGKGRKGKIRIRAGQEGWLRITLLDPILFRTFIGHFLHGPVQAIVRLGKMTFHVSEILSTPEGHFLAGSDSLASLHTRWLPSNQQTNQPADLRTIPLTFSSPTAFSIRNPDTPFRYIHVLPDPALVFGELARYWDDLTGSDTIDAVRAYALEAVVVSRHSIKTHMYQYRRSKQVGFTGRVHFHVLDKENTEMICHLNRLADLAFYTGLGSKTAQGMGQVRRINER